MTFIIEKKKLTTSLYYCENYFINLSLACCYEDYFYLLKRLKF
nr:MAG TPA: hypothetical protein [Caudoviricetes sp.]